MQHHTFTDIHGQPNGGVIHGITGSYKGRVSAWYDKAGKVIDMKQVILLACRTPKRDGPMWKEVEKTVQLFLAQNAK